MWIIQSRYGEADFYVTLEKELTSLIESEKNLIANLANLASWIFHSMPDLNWSGFYLWDETDQELVLGPFQGRPACIRIKPGKGACGTAYSESRPQRVNDVNSFPGHIACDSASLSELVIPLLKNGKVMGVLDLDSPILNRFSETDATQLTRIMKTISEKIY